MQRNITCPACGEAEELSGSDSPDGIRITCGSPEPLLGSLVSASASE